MKKARFLLFPLISLAIMSTFSMYSMGFFRFSGKKQDSTVFEKIEQLKRHVASVNSDINKLGTADDGLPTGSETAKLPQNKKPVFGEMHLASGSTVRSLVEANCNFEALEKTVVSSQIKFDFVDCPQPGSRMKLKNKTNGYEAQIFPNRGKKVSSDFIQLEHGANELIFEISSTAGQIKSQVIKIKRIQ